VIHCDLKPDNILITHDDIAKITDLGVSQLMGDDDRLTKYNASPAFMPPESCALGMQLKPDMTR
jgi:serine/threonine-protein kinase